MKKINLFLTSIIVILMVGVFGVLSCKKDPLDTQGNIEGNVVDSETGDNLSGVNVTIVSNSSTTFSEQSKLTGSDGKFSFKDLEAGNYKLTFSKEGYENNSKNISLQGGQTSSSDVLMKPVKAELSVTPELLDFGQEINMLSVEIRNSGKGELNWSIVKNLPWLEITPISGKTTTEASSVSITVDRTLITSESQTGSFVINSNGGSKVIYVMAGKANPILSVTQTLLDFGQETNIIPIEIKNIGKGELNWSITEDLSWLSVNPVSGKTTTNPSTVNVTVDRTLITNNSQTGSFIINSNGGSVVVNVSVGKAIPVLSITQTMLDFGQTDNILPIEIKNIGKGELSWSITKDLTWLSVNPSSGKTTTNPSTVNVTVDRKLITSNIQTGSFVVNSNGGSVVVYVSVAKAIPVLSVTPTLLDFGQTTNVLPIEIKNTGKGELNWSITEDLVWLSVNPVSGKTTTNPATVNVTVDRNLITGNSQTGSFLVNSDGGSTVVNVTVSKAGPVLNVAPASLDFGEVEIEKSLNISNVGAGTLTYEASCAQSWATLENKQGSTTTEIKTIKVKVSRAGLTTGNYTGSVIINSNNNSVTVPISMSVMQPTAPNVLNGQASAVTHSTAQVSGSITSLGSSAVTQHGHCWSTSPNPSTADNKTSLGGTSVTGSFTSNLTGLTNSTTYYVKAYATNSVGTKYSDQITFTTLSPPTMPTVLTQKIENIQHNSVDAKGNLTVLGDGFVTDYGFCYSSTIAAPTTADSKKSLGSTTKIGEFNATITGLSAMTKYFIRAYATNSMGTAYGNVIEATTTDAPPVVTSGLVAYYTFDNENCNESRGKTEYNGIKQGAGNPVWSSDIPGHAGKALQLSKDAYFQMPTNPMSRGAQWSHSVWLKTMSNCSVWTHQTSGSYYLPSLQIFSNKVSAYYYGSWGYFDINISEILLDGNWHLVTITRNSGNHKLYIDGILYSSYSGHSSTYTDNPYPLQLGNGFTGIMDNVRYYNRELTQSEITEIYNAKQ